MWSNTSLNASSNEENFSVMPIESRIALGSLMIFLAVIGFSANGVGVYMCLKMGSIRPTFCNLYLSVAISDCCVLANFAFYVAPMIITQSEVANYRFVLAFFGFYQLLTWCVSVFSTLNLAINRLIATLHPLEYSQIYKNSTIKYSIRTVNVISLFYAIWFVIPDCEFRMNPAYGVFAYTDSQCGVILDIICSVVCCIVFVIIFILNGIAVLQMYHRRRAQVEIHSDSRFKRRKLKERAFLLQTCINCGLFQCFALAFHVFSRVNVSFLTRFFMKTVIWEVAHMANGFVFLALNEEIRLEIWNLLGFSAATSQVSLQGISVCNQFETELGVQ